MQGYFIIDRKFFSELCIATYLIFTCYLRTYVFVCTGIDPPNNVKATVLAPKIIEVSWDPFVSTEVTSYIITYTTTAVYTTGNNVTVHGHNVSKVLLRNLEENTPYSITVQSVSANTVSGPSIVASLMTWPSGKCSRTCSRVRLD